MDIGVLPVPLDETLEYPSDHEVGTVELGCRENPGRHTVRVYHSNCDRFPANGRDASVYDLDTGTRTI